MALVLVTLGSALGIKEGVEPSDNMRAIARQRGLEVMNDPAEHLPYKDRHFDFVLFVTVCHLENVQLALKEAYRVLKLGGSVIIGFIDRNGAVGQAYEARRDSSVFYRDARFCSVREVEASLAEAGFQHPVYVQTLFRNLDEIDELEEVREGYGEGSFVVVRAVKEAEGGGHRA